MRLAERHTALGAARGLRLCFFRNEFSVDLVKVYRPPVSRTLVWPSLPDRHKPLHAFGHERPFSARLMEDYFRT